jgi:uncharacterized membrane protein YfcA
MLGLGGGLFLVPALSLLFHIDLHLAIGTSLIGVIATSAGVASVSSQNRMNDVPLALNLELGTTAGAITGSLIAGKLSPQFLSIMFGVFVLLMAVYTVYKGMAARRSRMREAQVRQLRDELFTGRYKVKHWGVGVLMSYLAGNVSGLSGVGGGFIKVPIMYSVMGVPLGVATATSNFMVGITAAASVFVYYSQGYIAPLIAVPTAFGVFGGAILGAKLYQKIDVRFLRGILVGVLFYISLQMIWKGIKVYVGR